MINIPHEKIIFCEIKAKVSYEGFFERKLRIKQ